MTNFPDVTAYGYGIEKTLGQNFHGRRFTYLARHLANVTSAPLPANQWVVLKKFAFDQGGADWGGYDSIEAEIKVLQRLNHEQIPDYLGSFTADDGFYLVTEYIDAPTLAQTHNLSFEDIKAIAVQLLKILYSLQQQQPAIIHRDIKPENILVKRWGQSWRVYLIDFGFARLGMDDLSVSSTVKGTLGFMPPEQIFQRELTTASDLYSLGVTLVAILCKRRSGEIGALVNHDYRLQFRQELRHIPDSFLDWLEQLTEPRLAQRYPDAKTALRALLQSAPAIQVQQDPQRDVYNYFNLAAFLLPLTFVLMTVLGIQESISIPTSRSKPVMVAETSEPKTIEQDKVLPEIKWIDQENIKLYQEGLRALREQRYDEASYYYNLILETAPNYFDALSDNCAAHYYLNQPEAALAFCERAIAINNQDYRVHNRHGLVLVGSLNRPAEALLSFERSQQLNPDYFWAWVNHARALSALERYHQAIISANKGIKIAPDKAGGWYEKCRALRKLGALSLALEACDQGILAEPTSDLMRSEQGKVLYAQQNYQQALQSFEVAIQLNPDNSQHQKYYQLVATALRD